VGPEEIYRKFFGDEDHDIQIGRASRIVMARARDSIWAQKVQNGGVVSALTDFAIDKGIIQAAVLTGREENLLPRGCIATSREHILACAGSGYASGPTLEALNRGPWQGDERIGVVGLPCQVLALARMRTSSLEIRTPINRVDLVIGLFCTWAFDHEAFTAFLGKRFDDRPIGKLDITPPPERLLKVTVGHERHDIPLDDVRPLVRKACEVCFDMTSEFSDISVGTVEGKEGWNTVLVRTTKGDDLISRAEESGILETLTFPEDKLDHLKEASLLKKRRALDALKERGELEEGYLMLSDELLQRILSESQETIP
jgi:coenzyme F420 hydrogenase subunit beta